MRVLTSRAVKAVAATAVLAGSLVTVPWATATASAAPVQAAPVVPGGGGHMQAGDASATPTTRMGPMATPQAAAAKTYANYSVKGIDVASYQQNVNWTQVANAGYQFALVKATEGTTYTNSWFSSQYNGAKAAGLYTSAYAFARPDGDPVAQARYFLNTIDYRPDGYTLPPMLDMEGPYSGTGISDKCWNKTPAQMVAWAQAFVGTVTRAIGRPMIIYTGAYWWNDCTHSSTALSGQMLDLPAWQTTAPTYLPAGWPSWTFWQYTSTGGVPGVPGANVDQNVFYGSRSQLAQMAAPAVAPGTSPSIAALTGGGYVIAYQSINGMLTIAGTPGFIVRYGMMAGTSPAVTALANGGYEVAFQANTGFLWVTGTQGSGDTRFGMMAGTNPAIAAFGSGYEVAFQANTGFMWVTGSAGTRDTRFGMMAGTSPAIASLSSSRFQTAFQANTGMLWLYGSAATGNTRLGMAQGTNPAITGLWNGSYQATFQANTGYLWCTGWFGTWGTTLGMAKGTSPGISAMGNNFGVTFQSSTGMLWTGGAAGTYDHRYGMQPGTSPTIAGLSSSQYETAFQANTGALWVNGSLGTGPWR